MPGPLLWGPQNSLNLQSGIQLGNNNATVISGNVNPSSVATAGNPGDIYISTATDKTYQKQDSGTTTNWSVFTTGAGGGTVTTVSVVSANGLAGTVTNPTTTPAITLSTSINAPVLAGNGTSIGAATLGNLTEATSSVLTFSGGTGSVIGSGTTIQVKQASTSQSGYLSSTDWNTFNNKGSGSVTSVGLSVPASSLFSVSGTPVTSSGTLALATSGTSGGIPYFSSTTQLNSSAALTANQLVIGGGAGTAPSSLAAGSQYQSLVMGASSPAYSAVPLNQSAAISGTLPIGNGGTGVTSVTTTPTANSFAGWDANSNFESNMYGVGYTTIVTAGGTTTLTASSSQYIKFTGSAIQNCQLPSATTLFVGARYLISYNTSSGGNSGSGSLLKDGSGSTLVTLYNYSFVECVLTNNSTTAGSWDVSNIGQSTAGGASRVVCADTNSNIRSSSNLIAGLSSFSSSSTLTISSPYIIVLTGTTASQSITLPVATSLFNGLSYLINNTSTQTWSVLTSGSNTLCTIPEGCSFVVQCINTVGGTGTASWSFIPSNISATSAGAFTITTADGSGSTASGALTIQTGVAGATAAGGAINITSAAGGSTSGVSGAINITTGTAASAQSTGAITIKPGATGGGGVTGAITIGGHSSSGVPGLVSISGGNCNGGSGGTGGALTLSGGSCANSTNFGGGALTLAGGLGRGTVVSKVFITAATTNTATSNSQTSVNRMIINGTVILTNSSASTIATCTMASNSTQGGCIRYLVEGNDGTNYQATTGQVKFALNSKSGTISSTITAEAEVTSCSSGTLTNAFSITSAGLIQVTPSSSLTTTSLIITYTIEIFGQQAVTVP